MSMYGVSSVLQLRQCLVDGKWAWPGGYPKYFVTADGEALSYEAVQAEQAQIESAISEPNTNTQWQVIGVDVNWEDPALYCSHTNQRIESAYAEDGVTP